MIHPTKTSEVAPVEVRPYVIKTAEETFLHTEALARACIRDGARWINKKVAAHTFGGQYFLLGVDGKCDRCRTGGRGCKLSKKLSGVDATFCRPVVVRTGSNTFVTARWQAMEYLERDGSHWLEAIPVHRAVSGGYFHLGPDNKCSRCRAGENGCRADTLSGVDVGTDDIENLNLAFTGPHKLIAHIFLRAAQNVCFEATHIEAMKNITPDVFSTWLESGARGEKPAPLMPQVAQPARERYENCKRACDEALHRLYDYAAETKLPIATHVRWRLSNWRDQVLAQVRVSLGIDAR